MSNPVKSKNQNQTTKPPTEEGLESLLPSQGILHRLPHKYKAFVGGVGSGKSYFGGTWAGEQTMRGEGDGMIVAPTYQMLADVSVPAYIEMLKRHNWSYNHIKHRNVIETARSKIFLRSAEHPERLRGPNLSWAWCDEAALFRSTVWPIMLGRLRMNNARGLITTTPAGFNFVHEYWVEKQNPSYGLVQASSIENRHLDTDFVKELRAAYTEEFAAQEIEGKFVTFEGLVYPEFSHDTERGNIKTWDIQEDWQRVRGIDFGYTNPFVCLWGVIDHDSRLYIYDEHYQTKRLISEHANAILVHKGDFKWTVSDWDAQERAELESAGISTVKAQKEVIVGIQKVKARLKRQADGKPRLIVHPRCVNLIKEFSSYRWNPKARGGKEEPIKESDHAMDALRYMVMEIDGGGFILV